MLSNIPRLICMPPRSVGHVLHQRLFMQSALTQKSFPQLVQEIKASNKNIHHISPRDLHALKSNTYSSAQNPRLPPHIIDVRERHEVETTGTIPGAIVLPRGILERDVGKYLKQNDPRDVVVYCAGGFRSILAAESLVRLGYGVDENEQSGGAEAVSNEKDMPKVWSLDEGMDGWIKSGYEVEKKSK
ncbi:hypothetical protein BX616_008966 [Lobosporangium transversale]|uniref:Rhodanese-like domain-containing protein n=1 Tax=Lobosporangium transversale TaxID=64571 RepID=A0A1Y2GXX2_9FUNG|nr:Rhodanese-like domain-containing protein [Lobosporangium transversale]KAF9918406.1 hypothetical protein BX616_008966 [Lobosporangium transversale]ORZ22883.1 Rhodanese-like domain-containing protein [Lobosporangium transversale]|eukprot:XP_021883437.1 Rhodanese-like domain-containing protein [Lobosporangium transversale]